MSKLIGALPFAEWPHLCKKYNIRGVYVGGCVDGTPMNHRAHAHILSVFEGWICFRARGVPTDFNLIAHEVAHIITRSGHTRRFLHCLERIGAHEEAEAMRQRFSWLKLVPSQPREPDQG